MQTILGHADLLALDATDQDARDSTAYIHDAADRIRDLCDDLTDLLRLPALVDGGGMPLVLDALVESLTPIAAARGSRVRLLEPCDDEDTVVIDTTTYRILSHVIEHVVRKANSDIMLRASLRLPGDAILITVAPAPECIAVDGDSVVAIAAALLAARGGHVGVVGWRLELLVPVLE